MNFDNAELLSYDHVTKIKGNGFRYGIVKNLSILLDLDARQNPVEGVEIIWSGVQGILESGIDFQPVIVNGYDFGLGKIISINFNTDADAGIDVRRKKYEINLEIYDSGNFHNLAHTYYTGIDYENYFPLDDFDETFSASQDENGTISFQHAIDVRFHDISGYDPIQLSRAMASGLFNQTNLTGFLFNYSTTPSLKRLYTESYNMIDKSCSFAESSTFDTGNYVFEFQHSIETDQDGITTVNERGRILGNDGNSGYEVVKDRFQQERNNNIFNRCSGMFENYAPTNAAPLKPFPIEVNSTINRWEPSIEYSFLYTNDPSIGDGYTWEYTLAYDQNRDGIVNITEDGSVQGYGIDGYSVALNVFDSYVSTGIYNRVSNFYGEHFGPVSSLTMIQKEDSREPFHKTRGYSRTYTDDESISGLYIISTQITDRDPVHLVQHFAVVGQKEAVQPQRQSTQGRRDISITVSGPKNSTLISLLNVAKNAVIPPTGNDVYLNDASFSYDPSVYSLDLNASYSYHFHWLFNNVDV